MKVLAKYFDKRFMLFYIGAGISVAAVGDQFGDNYALMLLGVLVIVLFLMVDVFKL